MTSPTQADREAAADWMAGRMALVMAGEAGSGELSLIEAFMRHRLASGTQARAEGYAQGQRDMRDRAAGVADGNKWADRMVDANWADGDVGPSIYNKACDDTATAIRALSLKGQSDGD